MKKIYWWEVLVGFAATLALAVVLVSCVAMETSGANKPKGPVVVDTASDNSVYVLSLGGNDVQAVKIVGDYTPSDVLIDAEKLQDNITMMVMCGEGYLSIDLTFTQSFTGTVEALRLTGARIALDSVELLNSRHEPVEGSYSMEEVK